MTAIVGLRRAAAGVAVLLLSVIARGQTVDFGTDAPPPTRTGCGIGEPLRNRTDGEAAIPTIGLLASNREVSTSFRRDVLHALESSGGLTTPRLQGSRSSAFAADNPANEPVDTRQLSRVSFATVVACHKCRMDADAETVSRSTHAA